EPDPGALERPGAAESSDLAPDNERLVVQEDNLPAREIPQQDGAQRPGSERPDDPDRRAEPRDVSRDPQGNARADEQPGDERQAEGDDRGPARRPPRRDRDPQPARLLGDRRARLGWAAGRHVRLSRSRRVILQRQPDGPPGLGRAIDRPDDLDRLAAFAAID